jgi:hypothetical protein
MSPWIHYNTAILAILAIVREVVPMSDVQQRRVEDAEAVVRAVNRILEHEDEDDEDGDGDYGYEDEDDEDALLQ